MRCRSIRWAGSLAALLVCAAPLGFADSLSTYPDQGIQTFLGLDDTSAPTQVQDGRAQDLQNVLLDISKSVRKRYGDAVIGDSCDVADTDYPDVTGLYYTKFSSGTERIIRNCGTALEYLSGTSWLPVVGTYTAGQNNQFVYTTALDNIVGTNNVDPPFRWTGDASAISAPINYPGLTNQIQKAGAVVYFKNYLIFGNLQEGGTRYSTRIRWSPVGDPFATLSNYSNDDRLDIASLGGQEITAFVTLYDTLYVFLTDSLYKVSLVGGAETFQVSKVLEDIGTVAKNSVQTITLTNSQTGVVFLDKDKRIYFFDGSTPRDLSIYITQTMKAVSGSRLQYAVSAHDATDYYLCLTNSTGSTNDLCLVLQYQIGEWSKDTNLNANAMAHVLDSDSTDQIYFGSYHSLVYQLYDTARRDDVASATGTITATGRNLLSVDPFVSDAQVIFDSSANYVSGALVGAPIEIVSGTGIGQTNTITYNTTTGIFVATDFTTTPAIGDTFEIGAIDAFYITKWYDFHEGARMKHFNEVYFWADADVSSTNSLSYANDFSSNVETVSVALSASSTDSIWGSAIWGVSLWGDLDTVFRHEPLKMQGRYMRLKWAEDDPQEDFHIYGWNAIYRRGEVN